MKNCLQENQNEQLSEDKGSETAVNVIERKWIIFF